MSEQKTRIAVIGTGHLGRFHAQKFSQMNNVQFVGVVDVDGTRAEQVAKEVGGKAFTKYQDVVDLVDAVTIATPTTTHFEVAKFFLEKGKHVHIEKPLTASVREGEELCALAKSKNLILQVGHVERFNPALVAAKDKLGIPLFIEVHRLAPFKPRSIDVDVVLDLMIHDLDVVMSLVKSPVKSVSAVGTPVLTKTYDIANVRLEFESHAVANLTASRVSLNATRKFRVFQKSQYLSIDFGSGEVHLTTKTGEWVPGEEPPLSIESWNLEKGDALMAEDSAFVSAVRGEAPCLVTGEDGLNALRVAELIREDIKRRL
ncbi:MAG: Gfo/Idh/MocA family oxidoreductase [Bdellovibrionaceae bacterium]|nr:Gfo/Idh/MocA family oxidoreductase [Pseudobdellovibrionaceae bacterium]